MRPPSILAIVLFTAPVAAQSPTPAAAPGSSPPAVVSVANDTLTFSGFIDGAAVARAEQMLDSDAGRRVHILSIDSLGGNSEPARRLGRLVRARGLSVRIGHACAAFCAYDVVTATRHLTIPAGSFLLLSQSLSPTMVDGLILRSHEPGQSDAQRAIAARLAEAGRRDLIAQDAYYRELGLDPRRVYLGEDLAVAAAAQVHAAGHDVGAVLLMPDAAFLRQCFGIAQVDMPTFAAGDSVRVAHAGRTPLAIMIDSVVYFDGTRLPPSGLACTPAA